jgi:hypothetical protein
VRTRLALVSVFPLLALVATSPAGATEHGEGVDVVWSAPRDCPTSAELRERVTTRVPGDAVVRARGRVEHIADHWALALEIETASSRGERALEAPTCDALASSAAVVIAMSVAPPAVAPAPAPSPMLVPTPAPASDRVTPAMPDRAAPDESRPRFLVRGHGIGDSGTLPATAFGGGLAFGVRIVPDIIVEAGANLFASQDGTVGGTPARGASFTLMAAGVRACWALTRRIELAPCLGVEVERLSAAGFGAVKTADASAVTWSPEGTLALRVPIAGPLSLRAGLAALVPMSRQSFVINAAGTVHRPELVAFRAWLGPEVRF